MKFFLVLCLASLAIVKALPSGCAGCPAAVEGADNLKEVEKVLNFSLLSSAEDSAQDLLTLVKINFASIQVVSGSKHIINADLKDKNGNVKTCDIEIWTQSWLDSAQTTLKCPGKENLVKSHKAYKA